MTLALVLLAAVVGTPTAPPVDPTQPPLDQADHPPEPPRPYDGHHPSLRQALDTLDHDLVSVQRRDLSTAERARLALEVRDHGARLSSLVVGEPDSVKKQALDIERRTARLSGALNSNDRDSIGREASALSTQMSGLRAAMTP